MRLDSGRLESALDDMKNARRVTRGEVQVCHYIPCATASMLKRPSRTLRKAHSVAPLRGAGQPPQSLAPLRGSRNLRCNILLLVRRGPKLVGGIATVFRADKGQYFPQVVGVFYDGAERRHGADDVFAALAHIPLLLKFVAA